MPVSRAKKHRHFFRFLSLSIKPYPTFPPQQRRTYQLNQYYKKLLTRKFYPLVKIYQQNLLFRVYSTLSPPYFPKTGGSQISLLTLFISSRVAYPVTHSNIFDQCSQFHSFAMTGSLNCLVNRRRANSNSVSWQALFRASMMSGNAASVWR